VFAFGLATLGAWYRDRRTRQRRDEAVVTALRAEVQVLKPTAQNDLNLVRDELKLLPGGQTIDNPLDPLGSAFFELVRVDPPKSISEDADLLLGLRDIARRTGQVDEMIRAREAFTASNRALASFTTILGGYDQLIERWFVELIEALEALDASLAG
jgi:hypothetical protein